MLLLSPSKIFVKTKPLLHEALPSHLAKSAEIVLFRTADSFRLVWHVVLPGVYDGLKTLLNILSMLVMAR